MVPSAAVWKPDAISVLEGLPHPQHVPAASRYGRFRDAQSSQASLMLIPRFAHHTVTAACLTVPIIHHTEYMTTVCLACSVPASKSTWSTDGRLLALVTEGAVSILDGKSLQQVRAPLAATGPRAQQGQGALRSSTLWTWPSPKESAVPRSMVHTVTSSCVPCQPSQETERRPLCSSVTRAACAR